MPRALLMDKLTQDLHHAFRALAKQPLWTTVAIATIGLGVGASTAMFGAVNGLLLHPLPYRAANRVVIVWQSDQTRDIMTSPSPRLVDAWRQRSHTLESIEVYATGQATLAMHAGTDIINTVAIRPTFLAFAGAHLLAGRPFVASELERGAGHVVILGEGLWRRTFGGDTDVVGKAITIDAQSYSIIGIAPAALRVPSEIRPTADAWIPLTPDVLDAKVPEAMARLRSNSTTAVAEHELNDIARTSPGSGVDSRAAGMTVILTRPSDTVRIKSSLLMLSAAAVLLLLISCANVAHLQIARRTSRARELAIRSALGASSRDLRRLVLIESGAIAMAGCVLGIAVAVGLLQLQARLLPASLSDLARIHVDGAVLVAAVLISLVSALLFGFTSAWGVARSPAAAVLKRTALAGTASRRTGRFRAAIVVSETALSTMLLVGAVLLLRTMMHLQRIDTGFDARNLYSVSLSELRPPRYPDTAVVARFSRALVERVRALPGIAEATVAAASPSTGTFFIGRIEADDANTLSSMTPFMSANFVPPDYFHVIRLRLIAGRAFDEASERTNEVIVNEGLAKALWPNRGAVGKRIRFPRRQNAGVAPEPPWLTVVGVASNTHPLGLTSNPAEPLVYFPSAAGTGNRSITIIARARPGVDPVADIRRAVTAVDPYLGTPVASSVASQLSGTIAMQRFVMFVLTMFAGLAVTLSAVGLFGLLSFTVAQRSREIGIRVALGAAPSRVARTVVVSATGLAAVGLVVGSAGALGGWHLLRTMLYGVTPNDPSSYLLCGGAQLLVAIVAAVIPAVRAARVNPLIAMRAD